MPFFPVDDQFAMHPKALAAGNAAIGLWVRAGSWCKAHAQGGVIPAAVARSLGSAREAKQLVEVGLWENTPFGYAFHDWEDYEGNHSSDEEKARRDASRASARERKARSRAKQAEEAAASVTPGSARITHLGHADVTPIGHTDVTPPERDKRDGHTVTSRTRGQSQSQSQSYLEPDGHLSSVPEVRGHALDAWHAFSDWALTQGIDGARVRERLAEVSPSTPTPEAVQRFIEQVLQRATPRTGDRTGLILSSLKQDRHEWDRVLQDVS